MIQKRYNIIPFDSNEFNFHEVVGGVLTNLENLHYLVEGRYTELFEIGHDSSTIFHKAFYDKYRAGWKGLEAMYYKFISEVIAPNEAEDFLYQKFPTFRVHLPGNVAVGKFHNDAEFGHPVGEKNFIIPLTNSTGSASVWIESEVGKKDFDWIPLFLGQLASFNGNALTHGNKVNESEKTRVSMDFRILPISMYNKTQSNESITTKTKFTEGEYYKRFCHNRSNGISI